jgi:hypothetical protein
MAQLPIVGFTLSYPDGTCIGKWIQWMTYYDTEDEARKKATDHIKFLKDNFDEDVVLVTLYGAI